MRAPHSVATRPDARSLERTPAIAYYVRRKFFEAEDSDKALSDHAMTIIQAIYAHDKIAAVSVSVSPVAGHWTNTDGIRISCIPVVTIIT